MTERRVAIIGGTRTPFVKAGKALKNLGPLRLACEAVRGLIERHHIPPDAIEALVFGVTVPEPGKPNLAREIVFEEKLPSHIEAQTVSSYGITGLRTIASVADAIRAGRIDCAIAGGVDSLSRSDPATFKEPSTGLTMGQHTETTRKEWKVPQGAARTKWRSRVTATPSLQGRSWRKRSTRRRGRPGQRAPRRSSLALGHPWAATGGRIVTGLANEMARRDARYGLASICAAGGMAGAFILERP